MQEGTRACGNESIESWHLSRFLMEGGNIVAGALAPHPPHLVYAENPPQNEPTSEGGWEMLRWGYERMRGDLSRLEYDVIIVLSAHWQTYVGNHILNVPHFESLSVDPVFPHLFRYHYSIDVDCELAQAIHAEAQEAGLVTQLMNNPDYRVDYGTIVSCHMTDPEWTRPIVSISSFRSNAYYSTDVMQEQMLALGKATRAAIESTGRRALLLASNSLSHRHFVTEHDIPEDMSKEHIISHPQYLWDVRMIEMIRRGELQRVLDEMPEFAEQSVSEVDSGGLSWLIGALGVDAGPGELYGYGTVIGTGNAVIGWLIGDSSETEGAE